MNVTSLFFRLVDTGLTVGIQVTVVTNFTPSFIFDSLSTISDDETFHHFSRNSEADVSEFKKI